MEFPVFQFVPVASCPATGHHQEPPGCLILIPSHQVFIHTNEIPLSLVCSKLNSPSSLILFSYEMSSSPLIIFMALHWARSSKPIHFWYWGDQNWAQHSRCEGFAALTAQAHSVEPNSPFFYKTKPPV